jgi:hypothetical protein
MTHGREQTLILLPGSDDLLRSGPDVFDLEPIVDVGRQQAPTCDVGNAAVVGNPEQEGSLGALASESGERLPYRDRNFLKEILAFAGSTRIACRQTGQRGSMCCQQRVEPPFDVTLQPASLHQGTGPSPAATRWSS